MSVKKVIRVIAGTAGVLLVAGAAGPGAAAVSTEDSGDVQAVVRKTVRQAGSATGEISNSTMYTQITAVGNGTKTVKVPVGTTSNRNLNSFGPFPMEGESMVVELSVADGGGIEQRTVTDAEINPMAVSVTVMLDGAEIAPEDLVGANGVLDVEYTVRNTTATTVPVKFTDVNDKEITEDVDTAEPFVGSLDVILPQGFNEVTAPGATVAGNGQNETQLGYTFVLFPPLGSAEVKVGYQARITNGQMPAAEFSFLPIVPFDNSTIAGTAEAWKGGAATGASIYGAGTQIGDNLLKLQDGAGQLVAGLGQLAAGATQLSDGLVNTAAPGAEALADGTGQVADGLDQLNANVPALADGVEQLDDGAQRLNDGASDLAAGLNDQIAPGAEQLATGTTSLSTALNAQIAPGAKELAAGMTQLNSGLKKLDGNFNNLAATVYASAGYQQIQGALATLKAGLQDSKALLGNAEAGLTQIETALTGASTLLALIQPGGPLAGTCTGLCQEVVSESPTGSTLPGPNPGPGAGYLVDAANAGAGQILTQIPGAIAKTDAGIAGIGDPNTPGQTIAYGVKALVQGIQDSIVKNPEYQSLLPGAAKLDAGAQTLAGGVSQAAAGATQLSTGANSLSGGIDRAASGSETLAAGTETLSDGTTELNSKVPALSDGVSQLADGAGQVDDGANQLADGLGAAADGSGQLADGLAQAEPGGAQIEAGAGQLKEEGADVLADTGKEAQLGFAKDVALLEASQQAGLEGAGIPFGPAEGTDVVTTAAYKMYLSGITADTENNALKFGLGALLIAGAGGAAFAARRKVTG